MVMVPVNERIIERSISHFSYSGLEQLSRDKSYLFVSNHRDIMLDASLLQHILHLNGYETSEITFGANLMSLPLLIDIGRANKMFRVERGGSFKVSTARLCCFPTTSATPSRSGTAQCG